MSFEETVLDSKRKAPVESRDNPGELKKSRRAEQWVLGLQVSSLVVDHQTKFSMGPVQIRHSSHDFATQSSHSVDGWQAKMTSIETWIPWRNALKPHGHEKLNLHHTCWFTDTQFICTVCWSCVESRWMKAWVGPTWTVLPLAQWWWVLLASLLIIRPEPSACLAPINWCCRTTFVGVDANLLQSLPKQLHSGDASGSVRMGTFVHRWSVHENVVSETSLKKLLQPVWFPAEAES